MGGSTPAESKIAENKEDNDDNADNGKDVHLAAPIDGKYVFRTPR